MTKSKFKELWRSGAYNQAVKFPSVTVKLGAHALTLRFDSKDICLRAGYDGPSHPWLSALCFLLEGKQLSQLQTMSLKEFTDAFRDDQDFWDLRQEDADTFFFTPLELLHAALDIYRGRDYLYQDASPLVCRCFGVRESDIVEHLQKEPVPTLETLATTSKAGMGCRSCVPQLKRWLVIEETKKSNRFYKDKAVAEWLLEIDYMLSCFPKAADWKMEVESFKGMQVLIKFEKKVSQREEEETAKELQDFLGASLDSELGFFLRRSRHF